MLHVAVQQIGRRRGLLQISLARVQRGGGGGGGIRIRVECRTRARRARLGPRRRRGQLLVGNERRGLVDVDVDVGAEIGERIFAVATTTAALILAMIMMMVMMIGRHWLLAFAHRRLPTRHLLTRCMLLLLLLLLLGDRRVEAGRGHLVFVRLCGVVIDDNSSSSSSSSSSRWL